MKIIKTSEPGWLKLLAEAYRDKLNVILHDDAGVGVEPSEDTLFQMGLKAKISQREFIAVCIALGMSITGIALIVIAFFAPEPTSKLAILLTGGVACILGGGYSAIQILTKQKPPTIKVVSGGFEISW